MIVSNYLKVNSLISKLGRHLGSLFYSVFGVNFLSMSESVNVFFLLRQVTFNILSARYIGCCKTVNVQQKYAERKEKKGEERPPDETNY